MPTFCRSHSSLQLFHFSVEAIHWYLLFIFSLQFRFMLLLHCVCVCVSVWFFVFLLIGYVFLDECINRDVYFRVFDYFFRGCGTSNAKHIDYMEKWESTQTSPKPFYIRFDVRLIFSFASLGVQNSMSKKMFVCVLNTCVHLAKWFHISSISGCTENKSSFMHAERRVRERVSFFLHSNHSISRQYQ